MQIAVDGIAVKLNNSKFRTYLTLQKWKIAIACKLLLISLHMWLGLI